MNSREKINPFHPEAVATYGETITTCEHFQYMLDISGQLSEYLTSYDPARYGGAIGLRGDHGSGKTHLLSWLSQKAQDYTNINPIVLYGKADTPNFFDLYQQLTSEEYLSRAKIKELLVIALQNIADEYAGRAKITEDLKPRIKESPNSVATLVKEGNLDQEQLTHLLHDQFDLVPVPPEIPNVLLQIDSPTLGKDAYAWLTGKEVADLQRLGVSYHLRQLKVEDQGSSAPDVTAINALETIAALHNMANVPLIVLIDQLEVLLNSAGDLVRQQTLFSTIKKLIEQLGRQNALVFMAGNEDIWKTLPRDVMPRLRIRDPFLVGNLKREETVKLLEAYTEGREPFTARAINTLHDLSGGSPREIIRIAYYGYEEVKGRLSKVDAEILLRSSENSGSIKDRCRLALSQIDQILIEYGKVDQDVSVSDNILIDRLVSDEDRPVFAVVMVQATDKLSEIDSARRVNTINQYLENQWPSTRIIVVSVGYSSDQIHDLLKKTGSVIVFKERTFANQLKTEIINLTSKIKQEKKTKVGSDPTVLKVLNNISKRLEDLEIKRIDEFQTIQERISDKAQELAEPSLQEKEARTSWEILEMLERLQDELADGKITLERKLMRSMLVANESHIKNTLFDRLGGIYLDIVSHESWLMRDKNLTYSLHEKLRDSRAKIITEMRKALRKSNFINNWMNAPFKFALWTSLGTLLGMLFIFMILYASGGYYSEKYSLVEYLIISAFGRIGILTWAGVNVIFNLEVLLLSHSRLRRWRRMAEELLEPQESSDT